MGVCADLESENPGYWMMDVGRLRLHAVGRYVIDLFGEYARCATRGLKKNERKKKDTTIGSALLGIEPNMTDDTSANR